MSATALPVPGLLMGSYPERGAPERTRGGGLAATFLAWCGPLDRRRLRHYRRFADAVGRLEAELASLDVAALDARLYRLRAAMSQRGLAEALLVEAFALIRNACARALARRPFDTQIIAARIMLDNRMAEMATGEGKTLAAAICAAVAALAGIPVHVVTVNDYLVARDAQALAPLYATLGLTVGHVAGSHDAATRARAYACDITYCTAKELVFDYLRDRTVRNPCHSATQARAAALEGGRGAPPTLLRGLCMAVVDEADSILIDEARVPLILSEARANAGQGDFYAGALALARRLVAATDYQVDGARRQVRLSDAGREKLAAYAAGQAGVWHNRLHREETVCTALAALDVYRRDTHYLVRAGEVVIIDESTGRLAPGRAWSRGLHQMVEIKEGCAATSEQVTATQITYQRFFRRFLRLGGMSGTLAEARAELATVYGLEVVAVPLRRPGLRQTLPTRLYRDREAQWRAVIARTREVAESGRPVLIGTDSVAESEELSHRLEALGIAHAVLNARQDADEADTVARAGEAGRVTVATNMAGRGTDIPLGPGVAGRGGLHVICCQHNASRRIDRQLAGRAARQGDPGSAETLLSLDQPRLGRSVPASLIRRIGAQGWRRPAGLVEWLVRFPQRQDERAQRRERRELLARDSRIERDFALVGALE